MGLSPAFMKIDLPSSLVSASAFRALPEPLLQGAVMPAAQSLQGGAQSGGLPGFLQVFEGAVVSVDARTQAAGERMRAVELGQSDDLVGAMLASQEAGLSFSMLMQVRNKVMGAVDEVVKLQV